MDVEAAADELYGVAPGEFTALRNSLSKQVAADGDVDTAKQIRGLPKPALAAWVANLLVRNHRNEIDALLQLGESLRDATERLHGDELTALSKQQRQIIGTLVKAATADADATGQRISGPVARLVEQTLRAALADPDAGNQLAAGRLVEPLEYVGFPGAVNASAPLARTRRGAAADAKDSAAETARADARATATAAERERSVASKALAEANRKVELVGDHLDDVRRRQKELADQLRAAERDQRAAAKAHERAEDAVESAKQRLRELG